MLERKIDALIRAGWLVLARDFDEEAFLNWRMRAHECLEDLLGPTHPYSEHFKYNMRRSQATTTLLSGVGVLAAVELSGLHEHALERRTDEPDPDKAVEIRSSGNDISAGDGSAAESQQSPIGTGPVLIHVCGAQDR